MNTDNTTENQTQQLRIAMLIDCYGGKYVGGGQIHVEKIKTRLEEKYGCSITIFSQTNAHLLARLFYNLWVIPVVVVAHLQHPFDCLHAQPFSAGISGKIISFLIKKPVIYAVHGSHTLDLVALKVIKPGIKYYLEKLLLTQIPYTLQTSDSAHFFAYSNVNKHQMVIENGTDETHHYAGNQTDTHNKKPHLLCVSRLEREKGLDVLLKALNKTDVQLGDYLLTIVGSGSLERKLNQMVIDLGLRSKVEFIGKKIGVDLEKEYAKADLLVLPSLAEGMPIVILDAFRHKKPVLVTRAGHNPYTIEEEEDGFLTKVNDINDLARGLVKAFEQRGNWRSMGERGCLKVMNQYTWDIAAKKTYEAYLKAIEIYSKALLNTK